jgi:hypothetical protein
MTYRPLLLVPAMALIAGASATAADAPGPGILGANGNLMEVGPGKVQGGARQVYIQGLVDLDALQQGNYSDGNGDLSDHRSQGWLRAEFGTRIAVDNRIEVQVTVAGQGVMGDSRPTSDGSIYSASAPVDNGPPNGQSGNAVIDDAFIKLKDFLGYRELAVDAGRMPVSWNMRNNHSGFLYDSRADYRTVASWDGIRADYNLDTLDITPYAYRLPDYSQLYGIVLDWEPAKSGDDRLFFTGSANLERNVLLRDGTTGDSLQTYYFGADANLGALELYGEFAMQGGDQTDDIEFAGIAASAGIDLHADQLVLGLQFDYYSGDDNPTDNSNDAFINNWEGVSDTYIVESEKYGELSRLLTGNLQALKGKVEFALDAKKRVRIKSVYAYYKTDSSVGGASKNFGQEADLHLAWDYTTAATITLLGGVFKPDDAYRAVSPAGVDAGDDIIYLLGANLLVKF